MTKAHDTSQTTLRLDPSDLYWGVIRDLGPIASVDSLRFAFERVLPLPVDGVECRFVFAAEHSAWIACGIACEELHIRLGERAACVESVVPQSLPEFLEGHGALSPEEFEFRSGRYSSPSRHRHRRRTARVGIAAAVAMSFIVTMGFMVSTNRLSESAHAIDRATESDLNGARTSFVGIGNR